MPARDRPAGEGPSKERRTGHPPGGHAHRLESLFDPAGRIGHPVEIGEAFQVLADAEPQVQARRFRASPRCGGGCRPRWPQPAAGPPQSPSRKSAATASPGCAPWSSCRPRSVPGSRRLHPGRPRTTRPRRRPARRNAWSGCPPSARAHRRWPSRARSPCSPRPGQAYAEARFAMSPMIWASSWGRDHIGQ